jgi:hypothetical protein
MTSTDLRTLVDALSAHGAGTLHCGGDEMTVTYDADYIGGDPNRGFTPDTQARFDAITVLLSGLREVDSGLLEGGGEYITVTIDDEA